jgi:site-specific DNA recombinase
MYMDKLDGRIDAEFFDRKAAEFRSEQCRLMRDLETHQSANRVYIEEGIELLELAQRAHRLFESQPPSEKKAAGFCTFELPLEGWHADGGLSPTL